MTKKQVCLQLRPAQIEIAILQTQGFSRERIGCCVELRRRRARIVEYQQLASMNFDVTSCELRVACALSTRQNFASDRNHILTTQLLGFRMCFGCVFRVENDLSDT